MERSKMGYSLHVGLNAVDPAHYAGWSGDLAACEADADDMQVIASSGGFTRSVMLKTRDATRARVIGEIEKAAGELRAGDIFFVSYSGHGGQVPDRNGDEDDFQDETWCLYDGQLVDDELYELWRKFPSGARVLVTSDSCHSGTVTRMMPRLGLAAPRREAPAGGAEEAPRYRAMPMFVATRTYQRNKKLYDDIQSKVSGERGEIPATVRLISGCQDNQLSSDGAFNGLFTATLLRVWRGGGFKKDYAAFHRAIVRRMPPDQTPEHSVIGRPSPEFDAERPFTV